MIMVAGAGVEYRTRTARCQLLADSTQAGLLVAVLQLLHWLSAVTTPALYQLLLLAPFHKSNSIPCVLLLTMLE